MRNLVCIILSIIAMSCTERNQETKIPERENLTQEHVDSVLTDFKFEYSNPVFLDSSNQVLLPITTRQSKRRKKFSLGSYDSEDNVHYWNILFYDKANGQTRLLTESKLQISDFSVNMKRAGNLLTHSILYKIRDIDYNNDNKLNREDPEHLFISDQDGTNLRRLSPENEDLKSFTIIPGSDQLIIRTKRDINKDFKFDSDDEVIWYRINLPEDSKPIEMVDSVNRKKIQNLYFDQWLKKK